MQPVPKVIVFDLDGTLWNPEMYQLSGGSPFTIPRNNNTIKKGKQNDHETNNNHKKEEEPSYDALLDRSGTAVRLIGETRQVLTTLLNDPRYAETYVAVSSTCDEPHWAAELLEKFKLEKINHNNNKKEWVPMGSLFTDLKEVYYASKADQHRTILKKIRKRNEDDLDWCSEELTEKQKFANFLFFDNQQNNISTVSKIGVACCYCGNGMTEGTFERGLEQWRQQYRKAMEENAARDVHTLLTLHKVHPQVREEVARLLTEVIQQYYSYNFDNIPTPFTDNNNNHNVVNSHADNPEVLAWGTSDHQNNNEKNNNEKKEDPYFFYYSNFTQQLQKEEKQNASLICRAIVEELVEHVINKEIPRVQQISEEKKNAALRQELMEAKERLLEEEEKELFYKKNLKNLKEAHDFMLNAYFREVLILRRRIEDLNKSVKTKKTFMKNNNNNNLLSPSRPKRNSAMENNNNNNNTVQLGDVLSKLEDNNNNNNVESQNTTNTDDNQNNAVISPREIKPVDLQQIIQENNMYYDIVTNNNNNNIENLNNKTKLQVISTAGESIDAIFDYEEYVKLLNGTKNNNHQNNNNKASNFEVEYVLLTEDDDDNDEFNFQFSNHNNGNNNSAEVIRLKQLLQKEKTRSRLHQNIHQTYFSDDEAVKKLQYDLLYYKEQNSQFYFKLGSALAPTKQNLKSELDAIKKEILKFKKEMIDHYLLRITANLSVAQNRLDALLDFFLLYVQQVEDVMLLIKKDAIAKTKAELLLNKSGFGKAERTLNQFFDIEEDDEENQIWSRKIGENEDEDDEEDTNNDNGEKKKKKKKKDAVESILIHRKLENTKSEAALAEEKFYASHRVKALARLCYPPSTITKKDYYSTDGLSYWKENEIIKESLQVFKYLQTLQGKLRVRRVIQLAVDTNNNNNNNTSSANTTLSSNHNNNTVLKNMREALRKDIKKLTSNNHNNKVSIEEPNENENNENNNNNNNNENTVPKREFKKGWDEAYVRDSNELAELLLLNGGERWKAILISENKNNNSKNSNHNNHKMEYRLKAKHLLQLLVEARMRRAVHRVKKQHCVRQLTEMTEQNHHNKNKKSFRKYSQSLNLEQSNVVAEDIKKEEEEEEARQQEKYKNMKNNTISENNNEDVPIAQEDYYMDLRVDVYSTLLEEAEDVIKQETEKINFYLALLNPHLDRFTKIKNKRNKYETGLYKEIFGVDPPDSDDDENNENENNYDKKYLSEEERLMRLQKMTQSQKNKILTQLKESPYFGGLLENNNNNNNNISPFDLNAVSSEINQNNNNNAIYYVPVGAPEVQQHMDDNYILFHNEKIPLNNFFTIPNLENENNSENNNNKIPNYFKNKSDAMKAYHAVMDYCTGVQRGIPLQHQNSENNNKYHYLHYDNEKEEYYLGNEKGESYFSKNNEKNENNKIPIHPQNNNNNMIPMSQIIFPAPREVMHPSPEILKQGGVQLGGYYYMFDTNYNNNNNNSENNSENNNISENNHKKHLQPIYMIPVAVENNNNHPNSENNNNNNSENNNNNEIDARQLFEISENNNQNFRIVPLNDSYYMKTNQNNNNNNNNNNNKPLFHSNYYYYRPMTEENQLFTVKSMPLHNNNNNNNNNNNSSPVAPRGLPTTPPLPEIPTETETEINNNNNNNNNNQNDENNNNNEEISENNNNNNLNQFSNALSKIKAQREAEKLHQNNNNNNNYQKTENNNNTKIQKELFLRPRGPPHLLPPVKDSVTLQKNLKPLNLFEPLPKNNNNKNEKNENNNNKKDGFGKTV